MMKKRVTYKLLFCLIMASALLQACKKNIEPITIDEDDRKLMVAPATIYNAQPEDFNMLSWGSTKSQPTPTHEVNGEVVSNKLYVFGGHDYLKRPTYWSQTKRSYVYNPAYNTWAAITDLPHLPSGSNFGGVTNEGLTNDGTFIYLAGGYVCNANGTGQVFGTKQVWKYNTITNAYEQLPNLPRALAVAQLKYLNGKLHFMGGADLSRNDVASHYVLDLSNLLAGWKTAAPLLNAVNQAGCTVYDGKIYIVGGARGHDAAGKAQKTLQVYDDATNKWKLLAEIPTARDHIASSVTVVGNRILVLGGETSYNVTSKLVSAYTLAINTWAELTPMPAARSGGFAAAINNTIYYSGGNFSVNNYKGVPLLSATSTVLVSVDDAYTRDGNYSAMHYGLDTSLLVKGSAVSGYTRSTYLKFSLNGTKYISSAKLRLFAYNADNNNTIDLSCFGIPDSGWSETGITYNTAPAAQATALGVAKANSQPKYIEFDVTNYVIGLLSSNSATISLMIKDASVKNSTVVINSKQAFANFPQLILTAN